MATATQLVWKAAAIKALQEQRERERRDREDAERRRKVEDARRLAAWLDQFGIPGTPTDGKLVVDGVEFSLGDSSRFTSAYLHVQWACPSCPTGVDKYVCSRSQLGEAVADMEWHQAGHPTPESDLDNLPF